MDSVAACHAEAWSKFKCSITESESFGETERRRLLKGNISAIFVGNKLCVSDNLFGTYIFVVSDERELTPCEGLASDWYALGFPRVPEAPHLIMCNATRETWALFCLLVMEEALKYNGSFAEVVRCEEMLGAGRLAEHLRLPAKKFKELHPGLSTGAENAPLDEFKKIFEYNRSHVDEWSDYVACVFTEIISGEVWGMTEQKHALCIKTLNDAFGEACRRDNDLFVQLLQGYCNLPLQQFRDEFTANANVMGVSVKFASDAEAKLYQTYIRCAHLAASSRCGEFYLFGSFSRVHNYTIQENIFATNLPFKPFLPLYWYIARTFFLTNGVPL